ncbi:MAG: hypothetical protein EBS19_11420 [Spirochaetia bacterium]|nr:hypothetical protein [Spirochaetia bacterium]
MLTTNPEGTTRQQLHRVILSFLEFTLPNGNWRHSEEWNTVFIAFLGSLHSTQVEEALANPTPIIRAVLRMLYGFTPVSNDAFTPYVPAPTTRRVLGKDHAKQISLVLDESSEKKVEETECVICCEHKCSVKTNCGHEFCANCVNSIIDTEKNKTSKPLCSFCRVPFSSLTTSDHFAYSALADFIKSL